jgi:hypothetical protein
VGFLRRAIKILVSRNLLAFGQNVLRQRSGEHSRLLPRPLDTRRGVTGVINQILDVLPQREIYLEVGIFKGATFQNVIAEEKWGVDIAPSFDYAKLPKNSRVFVEPSDDFFAGLAVDKKFDMVYIDAEHTFHQAYRELVHSINHINRWGVILLDDTVPQDPIAAIPNETESKEAAMRIHGTSVWSHQGDVWKLIFQVRNKHKNLTVRTILQPSRPRTIIWINSEFESKMTLEDTEYSTSLVYEDVFSSGIPREFEVRELGEILDEIGARKF